MDHEERIKREAELFARDNKKRIADEKTSLEHFPSEENPVSVFMAGSPGAGKCQLKKRCPL